MALRKQSFSRPQLAVFVLAFALIGFIIVRTFAANPNLPGDINNDNTVNITDLSILLTNYGTTNTTADLNADNTVNITDLSILLSHYGGTYTPPTQSSIYWGAYMDGNDTYDYYYGPAGAWQDAPWGNTGNTWDRFDSNAGKHASLVHYGQPPPWEQTTFYSGDANVAASRGALNMLDMGHNTDSLATMVSGGYDASIKTWADNVKAWGKPIFYRPWWEMNGTWFGWGSQAATNPAQYVNAWRHFHDVVAAQGATNVTWVWCPNTEFPGSTPLASLYPGDNYVDWTCIDGYNWGPYNGDAWTTFNNIFHQTYIDILAIAPTKPVMIGETASSELNGDKAAWVTDMLTTQLPQNYPKVKAIQWFNWRIYEKGVWQQWPIESSPASQAAFKSGVSSSYYAPASPAIVGQPLTKIQPLP